jgi:hypothetical protein
MGVAQQVCRVGDTGVGVCPCHGVPVVYTTTFHDCSPVHTTDGLNTAVITSVGISTCGHPTVALTGSPVSDVQGLAVHRIGDTGANCGGYVAITGSPYVDSE